MGLSTAATGYWESPFDYANQALLYLPRDLPQPNSFEHTDAVVAAALPVLRASRGRAFLLFTTLRALARARTTLQGEIERGNLDFPLLAQGEALAAADIADKNCSAALLAAEAAGRAAKKGIWAGPSATKNAESTGDILSGNGRFMLVEGRVLSVRQAGATTYLNFGRNWTRDFAVTISRRVIPSLEAAGMAPKSLENRRIRVRGFIETRTGPRIELLRVGQLELLAN